MKAPIVALVVALGAATALALPSKPPARSAGDQPLPFSGVTMISATARVELRDPRKPEFQTPDSLPFPLAMGVTVRTGTMSRALLEVEEAGLITLPAHTEVKVGNPGVELLAGRLQAQARTRQLLSVYTSGLPARVLGHSFTIEMPGRGRASIAALGRGRPAVAKVLAAKGLVEVQLPLGTVRARQLPIVLNEGSAVRTAANSFALIEYADGARVKLRADSAAIVNTASLCTVAAGAADIFVPEKSRLEVRTADRPTRITGAALVVEVSPPEGRASDDSVADLKLPDAAPVAGAQGWDTSAGQ